MVDLSDADMSTEVITSSDASGLVSVTISAGISEHLPMMVSMYRPSDLDNLAQGILVLPEIPRDSQQFWVITLT